jgi:hypothetical protein
MFLDVRRWSRGSAPYRLYTRTTPARGSWQFHRFRSSEPIETSQSIHKSYPQLTWLRYSIQDFKTL